MFVRWKRRDIAGRSYRPFKCTQSVCPHSGASPIDLWTPQLVRTERVAGRPRQRVVRTYASLRGCCLADPLTRTRWWDRIEWLLDCDLHHMEPPLPAVTIDMVRQALSEKVPPPTDAEWAAWRAAEEERRRQEQEKFQALLPMFESLFKCMVSTAGGPHRNVQAASAP